MNLENLQLIQANILKYMNLEDNIEENYENLHEVKLMLRSDGRGLNFSSDITPEIESLEK